MSIQFSFKSESRYRGQFVRREVRDAVSEAVSDLIDEGVDIAQRLAPSRTGELRESIYGYKEDDYTGVIAAGADHAESHEFGTRPHDITGFLKFEWANAGKQFKWNDFAFGPYGRGLTYENWDFTEGATVHHPGHGATPFLRPAQDHVERELGGVFEAAFDDFRNRGA